MSTDRREQILERLFIIMQGVVGTASCSRNRDELPSEKRPGIILLDGDEEARPDTEGRGRPLGAPQRIIIKPEIYIVLTIQKPQNLTVGADLNAMRMKILKAVFTDSTLPTLITANGQIYYAGCVTDLARDRKMEGEMGMMLAVTYPLILSEISA
jgi:hypothetical protein